MKKIFLTSTLIVYLIIQSVAQKSQGSSRIDQLLFQNKNQLVIDTCNLILKNDSLNPDIYYKMGVAYQNILKEDMALSCFEKAVTLNPEHNVYSFSLAKALYGGGKFRLAEPILKKLCRSDSLNWAFAYYLSGIYMQTGRFDDAIDIYHRFRMNDSTNYVYHDKMAFANLKKGDLQVAIEWYNKSLSLNCRNLIAIKNLSYLYTTTARPDTAIQLLTKGIEIDSTDFDLYVRRAQINFSKNYTKRAMDDYLFLLAAGDSSELYLKRAGIGYCYNLQPKEALVYLLKAYQADSTDYETSSYLGQCYYLIKDYSNSIFFYNNAIRILSAVYPKMARTQSLLADTQKEKKDYKAAIESYLKAFALNGDPNLNMVIANIYDDKLHNKEKAILYYQRFLNTEKNSKMRLPPQYIETVEKRLEYLKYNKTNSK